MILADVLDMMESRDKTGEKITFDIGYVTFDKSRGKGGAIKELKGVRKVGSKFNQSKNKMINVRAPGNSAHPFPIHIRLIISFNGEKVHY